jgi:hypothetical protein
VSPSPPKTGSAKSVVRSSASAKSETQDASKSAKTSARSEGGAASGKHSAKDKKSAKGLLYILLQL